MSSFAKRLILTFTAVPLLFCLIYFLPHHNHLGFAILAVLATIVGSYEMRPLLFGDGERPMFTPRIAAHKPIGQ